MSRKLVPEAPPNILTPEGEVDCETASTPSGQYVGQSTIARLYETYSRQLSAKLRKAYGNGPPDPDDVTQQAFQKLIERGATHDIRNLEGFLWRTARNLIVNDKRAQSVRSRNEFEIEQLYFARQGEGSSPENVLSARKELRAINEALRSMPDRRRRAFVMHRIEGLPIAEVGRRLRIAPSTAHKHIIRAAEDIQICLSMLHNTDLT